MEWIPLALASFFAGLVDAIVGGGGLVLLPALFAALPLAHPATLLGSNKASAVWGTAIAAWQYSRKVRLPWAVLLPALAASLLGAGAGAWAVTQLDPHFLRRLLPVVLLGVLLYTLAHRHMGRTHQPRYRGSREMLAACTIGLALGFYDGFFGPGTGSFFIFLFVRWLGYDFLHASAAAKLLNLATNVAALALFVFKGHVWWHLAAPMAAANIAGALLGTRLALRHGAGFVRAMFIVVVTLLLLKTGWDAFGGGLT